MGTRPSSGCGRPTFMWMVVELRMVQRSHFSVGTQILRWTVGGQHLSRGEVCVPATSCAFLCVTPRAQPPVFSLFPSQQGYQRYHCTCSELAPSPNFASASRPPAFCAFACRIGLLSALSHTHSACLRFTEVVGCKSRCVAPCWHVPRGSKGAPPPLALERATGTASAHC